MRVSAAAGRALIVADIGQAAEAQLVAADAGALRADLVLVSSGAVSEAGLADALGARGIETHAIGDCAAVGLVEGAMHGAAELVLRL